jgi:truncated hemoglobin YjbI
MSQVAAQGMARPTIGDILLSHGFIDAEALASSTAEQERTGKPLGQILVDRGTITRLELASALAEQWQEAPPAPRQAAELTGEPLFSVAAWSPPEGQLPNDDHDYVIGVQSAVTDLARRMAATEPLLAELQRLVTAAVSPEELQASLAEVRDHIDGSLERLHGLESALADTSARLDHLTNGLEEAFGGLQAETGELADRVAVVTVAAVTAVTREDVDLLQQATDSRLADIVAAVEEESRRLNEVRSAIVELSDRPVLGPEITERIEELAARIEGVAPTSDLETLRTEVSALAERLAATSDAASVAALRQDVDELAARAPVSPEVEGRLDDLDARLSNARVERMEALVTDLAARVESLGAVAASGASAEAIEELRGALEELGRRREGDEEIGARIEALAVALDELNARPHVDPALSDRVEALAQGLEQIAADTTTTELRAAVDALAEREGAGESAVADLSARIDELSSGLAALHDDDTTAALRQDIDALRLRLETDDASLADLRAAATELASRPAGDPELGARLTLVAARLDELVAERASAETRDADALEQIRLAVATARNDLVGALEAVAERVGALESRPEPDADDGSELSALRQELAEDLREGLAGITMQAPTAEGGWAEEAALLGERIDGLSELFAGALAAVPADPARPAERPAAPERSDGDTEGELERLRMAIERMGMHLGAQERAIAEVMRSRGVAQRMDELEARIEDVAAGAAAGGGGVVTSPDGVASAGGSADARALARRLDAAEAALEAEREKMFAKLDRMGSAIDWRLQRLEAAGTE